jgi:hypothetical protein
VEEFEVATGGASHRSIQPVPQPVPRIRVVVGTFPATYFRAPLVRSSASFRLKSSEAYHHDALPWVSNPRPFLVRILWTARREMSTLNSEF